MTPTRAPRATRQAGHDSEAQAEAVNPPTSQDMAPSIRDSRRLSFALLILEGVPAGRAYERAGYRQRGARADSAGHKLRHHPEVAAFIDQERERSRMSAEITRAELISLLGQIIFTPIAELDADSPLVQEFSCDEIGGGVIRRRVRMVDKLGAVKQLCQMLGWDQPERHKVKFEVAIGGLADE